MFKPIFPDEKPTKIQDQITKLKDVKMVLLSKMKNGVNTIERNDWKVSVRNQLALKRSEIQRAQIAEAVTNAAVVAPVVAPVPERRFPFRFL